MNEARLRLLLVLALDRLKLINGPDEKCLFPGNHQLCENHRLIHEIEDELTH